MNIHRKTKKQCFGCGKCQKKDKPEPEEKSCVLPEQTLSRDEPDYLHTPIAEKTEIWCLHVTMDIKYCCSYCLLKCDPFFGS